MQSRSHKRACRLHGAATDASPSTTFLPKAPKGHARRAAVGDAGWLGIPMSIEQEVPESICEYSRQQEHHNGGNGRTSAAQQERAWYDNPVQLLPRHLGTHAGRQGRRDGDLILLWRSGV